MTVAELEARLQAEGFKPDVYSIGGPLPTYEGLILEKQGSRWTIVHFERGVRRELESVIAEEEACERMYQLMKEYFK